MTHGSNQESKTCPTTAYPECLARLAVIESELKNLREELSYWRDEKDGLKKWVFMGIGISILGGLIIPFILQHIIKI